MSPSPPLLQLKAIICKAFPVEAYNEHSALKRIRGIAPWRSKLQRIALSKALGLLGDVLVDTAIAYGSKTVRSFDDVMLIYYLDATSSRDRSMVEEFSKLNSSQRKAVFNWIQFMKDTDLATNDAAAFESA